MKKIYGYAALFAAMSLASCSSENEPNVATGEMQKCYIGVNLAVPTETRAIDFVAGKAEESAVKSVTFVAFDAAGNYISNSGAIEDFNWTAGAAGSSIENTSASKVIALEKQGDVTVGQIMAIVNCPAGLKLNQNLDALRKSVGDYRTTEFDGTKYFVMTNSAYDEGNYATNFAGHVYETVGQAVADPVDMYVERVAARVDVSQADTFAADYDVDGIAVDGDKTLSVSIKGVEFIYAKDKAYLVKDIDGLDIVNAFAGWNDAANFRSHWAVDAKAAYLPLHYKDVKNLGEYSTYLNENVSATEPTYVAVTGELLLDGNKTEIYQLFNNSKYYTKEGVVNQILGYLQLDGYKYEADETEAIASGWADITAADIEIVAGDKDYDGYVKINAKEGYKLVNGEKEFADGTTIKDNKYRVYVWGGGNTYFYTKIAPADQDNRPGVVRNHVYQLVFNDIKGIGTPLFNPDGELLPKDTDKTTNEDPKWYFNATINILKWAVYTQEVSFE